MSNFIVFSGLDGSGKSTQIELLKDYYKDMKKPVLVFWSRGGYTPGFIFFKSFLRFIAGNKLPKSGNSEKRDKAIANTNIQRLWLNIAMLDLIFYYSIYLRIQSFFLGKIVICDRYIYDTYIDFKLNFPNQEIERWILWKILNILSLKPSKHYIALISVKESQKRSKQKGEPFPDTAETLVNRLLYYEKYIKLSNGIYINGLEKKLEIHNRIVRDINNKQ